MESLLDFLLKEPGEVSALRKRAEIKKDNDAAKVALGLALAKTGCSYEAAHLLRPRRALWKDNPDADAGKAALDAQAWWNRTWRDFAQAMQAGRIDAALDMLSNRAGLFWDHPPLLMHLGSVAQDRGQLDLAEHILRRVFDLSQRGLPKMPMAAFEYASQAKLIDVLNCRGDAEGALSLYVDLKPNSGNAMAHQLQGAALLASAGHIDAALKAAAEIVVTAEKERKGYSREMRLDFVDKGPDLASIRALPGWADMRSNPAAYLKRS